MSTFVLIKEAEKVKELIKQFEQIRTAFLRLKLHEAVNWERYNMMLIIHHSIAIECSSLTEMESRILLDEGATPHGYRPLLCNVFYFR